jgi:type I restriction enzyme S subunit
MIYNWQKCCWGDLVLLEYGKGLRGYEKSDGQYPVYGTNGPIGKHSKPLCNHPGVIIGRKGAYRGVHYSSTPFYVIDTAFYLEPKENINLKWAYYQLLTQDINGMDSGSAIPSTSRDAFYSLPVKIPPLPEQQAIAHILGSLDDKIELNRRMNETLESIARALFKSWFVDFDPVRAKMEGRELYGMDAETAALFPDGFEDSALGMIPRGWRVITLASKINILSGGTPKTSVAEYWQGSVPWVSIVDTVPGPYIISTEKTITKLGVENSAAKIFPPETIIITARGTVGNCALLSRPMAMNQSCYGLRGREEVGQLFLFHQVSNQIRHLKASAHGSVFDTITRSTFDNILIVCPEKEVLNKFELTARSLFDQILSNQQQNQTLTALRDTLLPKLIAGEIRVKDVEKAAV